MTRRSPRLASKGRTAAQEKLPTPSSQRVRIEVFFDGSLIICHGILPSKLSTFPEVQRVPLIVLR
jgi:hypothetical protein